MNEILKNNLRREYRTFSKYACKSSKGLRRYPEREKIPDRENIRPSFFHDTDRIMHSMSYTRYIDKTQVFFLFENDHITHRVLHVQFVSKIARVIGRCLRLNEDLIEAISLGHDIGHVPYGHDGETYLDRICQDWGIGHFCHNAQSVKFLMEIENQGKGLNLTLQVLDGILCHNGEIVDLKYEPEYGKTWDKFLEEYDNCWKTRGFSKQIRPMTLEACVMRVSDIIAYIGRDIEDAIQVKLIKREDIPKEITDVLGNTNDQIINNLALDIINNSYGKKYLIFSERVHKALDELMQFNYSNIYHNPRKQTENEKIENMFRQLFERYLYDIKYERKQSSIYKWYLNQLQGSEYLKSHKPERLVIDYISGMTDDFFNNEFREMFFPKSFGMTVE